ncbi:radical SAM protein [Candidatus Woesearchaeota archaeon CG10_big_fil_rev_8_21_14_0_10_44_13]|nr:MAG: radical SAM protein [Candidatus Woesearchaeota archaeon CG10_big_fil_rev_8_21_14_0_10_44_13]
MQKTKFYSWKTGKLAEGCRLCVEGHKLVLFVTGLCPRNCFYCPISDTKKDKDVVYANEWRLGNEDDTRAIIEEARLTEAKGASLTGGDPLLPLNRSVRYIRMLKRRFGKKFHIHLYASLGLMAEKSLAKLYNAGLDEIRIHPDFEDRKHWQKIDLINKFNWRVGMEIPAIPGWKKKTEEMIDYFMDKVDFLNINELEISDTNAQHLVERGFIPKNRISYGIKGSQQLAFHLLRKYGKRLPIHYCTTTLKDKVQLANRMKIRAKNAAKPYDLVTEDGMLFRGALYLKELKPGFGYRRKISKIVSDKAVKQRIIKKLQKTMKMLQKGYKIKKGYIIIDENKLRLLTAPAIAMLIKQKDLKPAVVTEYPTWDQTEVEVVFV